MRCRMGILFATALAAGLPLRVAGQTPGRAEPRPMWSFVLIRAGFRPHSLVFWPGRGHPRGTAVDLGDPLVPFGTLCGMPDGAPESTVDTSAARRARNDTWYPQPAEPPLPLGFYRTRQIIWTTVQPYVLGGRQSEWLAILDDIERTSGKLYNPDMERGVPNVALPPQSQSTVRWEAALTGRAMVALAVPYDARRAPGWEKELARAIEAEIVPCRDLLSRMAVDAVERLLADPENQSRYRLRPGRAMAVGEAYVLETHCRQAAVMAARPLMQQVTFRVSVVGAPAPADRPAWTEVTLEPDPHPGWTPEMPAPGTPAPVHLHIGPSGEASAWLPRGRFWLLSARCPAPYEAGFGSPLQLTTPVDRTIEVPVYVSGALTLDVKVDVGPAVRLPITVRLVHENGPLFGEAVATRGQDGSLHATFHDVPVGRYKVDVRRGSGGRWELVFLGGIGAGSPPVYAMLQ